jgi:hypothetical protein
LARDRDRGQAGRLNRLETLTKWPSPWRDTDQKSKDLKLYPMLMADSALAGIDRGLERPFKRRALR